MPEQESRTETTEGLEGPVRAFTDADGLSWVASEQPYSQYDRRLGRSLIFASESAVRRVRNYPADWATLSDTDLARLSWNA